MKPPQGWLPPGQAYYTPPPPQKAKTPDGDRPTAETMMQILVQEAVGRPNGFYWGGQPNPDTMLQQFVSYAKSLTQYSWSQWTTVGFNPDEAAARYFDVMVEVLKRIPATMADSYANPDASIYDVWSARA